MILREYKKEDADIIVTWIKTEEELYKWSANRIGKFPLLGEYLNENYAPSLGSGKFFPLTALDDEGKIVGHFFIRYPDPDNDKDGVCDPWVSLNGVMDEYGAVCTGVDECPAQAGSGNANGCP